MQQGNLNPAWVFAASAAVTFLAYAAGLSGPFLLDDVPNITANAVLLRPETDFWHLWAAVQSSGAGMLGRQVSMLSFWLNVHTTGVAPLGFKVTNLVIHLLTGFALYRLASLLLTAMRERGLAGTRLPAHTPQWTALAAASIWLLHPLNLTSVLYVVQRMNSLSALFTALALVSFVSGRRQLDADGRGWPRILLLCPLLGLLAVFSKENGALLPLYIGLIEICIFRLDSPRPPVRRIVRRLAILVALPAAMAVGWLCLHPDVITADYQGRSFTLAQRLETEARVLWLYVRWLCWPDIRDMGLYHDDIVRSTGLLHPPATLLAMLGWLGIALFAVSAWRRYPLVTLAWGWFAVGHLLESTILPLELSFEHRNYLPVFGLILGGCHALAAWSAVPCRARAALLLAVCAVLGYQTLNRSCDWSGQLRFALAEAEHHPESGRAAAVAALSLTNRIMSDASQRDRYYDRAFTLATRSARLMDDSISAHLALILLTGTSGRPLPAWVLPDLEERLGRGLLHRSYADHLGKLSAWQRARVITHLPKGEVEKLYSLMLSNARASTELKAMALRGLANYYIRNTGELDRAAQAIQRTLAIEPRSPINWIYRAYVALYLKEGDAAGRFADRAEQLDSLRSHRAEIIRLRQRIATLEPAANSRR